MVWRSGDLKRKGLALEVAVKLIQMRARFNPIVANRPKNRQSATELKNRRLANEEKGTSGAICEAEQAQDTGVDVEQGEIHAEAPG